VLILNVIGLLNKIYRYADVVYIGNGFGKSIHNVQEPAVFGVPIITGPHIKKFKEAVDLQQLGGLLTIQNYQELKENLDRLLTDKNLRKQKGDVTQKYALQNIGATDKIINYLKANL
jgi:3-deoxy-D-manno-octulosonic-acid transferase